MPRCLRLLLLPFVLLSASAFADADAAGAAAKPSSPPLLGDFWQPSITPPALATVGAAFRHQLLRHGATLLPAIATAAASPSAPLAPAIAAGVASYRAFHFDETVQRLDAVERAAEAGGGADLDGQQLFDLYLYRGLAHLERGEGDRAWADLVRAARIDSSRTLDPARVPPRALASFRRAVAEVAAQPRSDVEVLLPDGAELFVDGRIVDRRPTLGLGRHLVRVVAAGYEPFAGPITITGPRDRFAPELRAEAPPRQDDRVDPLRGSGQGNGLLVTGTLRRQRDVWRLSVRTIDLETGAVRGEDLPIGEGALESEIDAALARLIDPQRPNATLARTAPAPRTHHSRAWIWGVIGGAAGALVIAIPLGVVYGARSSHGVVGGALERLP